MLNPAVEQALDKALEAVREQRDLVFIGFVVKQNGDDAELLTVSSLLNISRKDIASLVDKWTDVLREGDSDNDASRVN